jgi:hypothetical protein
VSDNTPDEGIDPIDLSTMSEAELRAHHAQLAEQITELRAGDMTPAKAVQINELRAEANEAVQAVNAILALGAEGGDLELTPAAEAAPEADTADTTLETPVADENTPASDGDVVAAAEAIVDGATPELAMTAGVGDRPTAPAQPEVDKARVAYVAGAGQQVHVQGRSLDWDGLGRAWDSVRLSASSGPAQAVVANLPAFEDTSDLGVELLTNLNSVSANDRLIAESVSAFNAKRAARIAGVEYVAPDAHTAAICTPLDIIREIPQCGETDTPFTDLFPQRPIGRLGFTFTRGSAAADVDDAITLIDIDTFEAALDENDTDTWKPCIPIDCATPVEVTAEELVTCVTVQTSTELSAPERVQEFMHKLKVQRARRREQLQLSRFDDTASGFTFTGQNGYGSLPSLVEAVETLMPQLAYPERLDETDWDIVLEPGLLEKLTIDRHKVCNPVDMPGARSETLAWLRSHLGRPVTLLRDFKGASSFQAIPAMGDEAALVALPAVDRIRLVPASAYIYGSTGEESTGWQTDPQLVRQNRKQAFTAEYFLLAKHGCHPAAYIDLESVSDGGRGGCVTPHGYVEGGS